MAIEQIQPGFALALTATGTRSCVALLHDAIDGVLENQFGVPAFGALLARICASRRVCPSSTRSTMTSTWRRRLALRPNSRAGITLRVVEHQQVSRFVQKNLPGRRNGSRRYSCFARDRPAAGATPLRSASGACAISACGQVDNRKSLSCICGASKRDSLLYLSKGDSLLYPHRTSSATGLVINGIK